MTGETSLGRDVPRSAIPSVEVIGKEKELMEKFKVCMDICIHTCTYVHQFHVFNET